MAMAVALLLGFSLGFVGSIPVAGPIAALVLDRALAGKPKEARAIGGGSALAEGLYALLSFYGFTRVLHAFPALVPVAKLVGACVFVLLGLYLAFRKSVVPKATAAGGTTRRWLLGLSLTGANPTVLITWTGIIAALHSMGALSPDPLDALPFAVGVAGGSASWFQLLVWLVSRYRDRLKPTWVARTTRIIGVMCILGGLFTGIRLAFRLHWL